MFVSHHTLKWTRTCRSHGRHPHAHTAHFLLNRHIHPWRRGGNGNTNGLIRECFPKGAGFTAVGEQEVRAVYDAIDHRPRKRHGYRTPWEVHHSTVLHLL